MDFNIFVSVTERGEHLYISRTMESSFERNGLATMVVLGSVGNIYLPSLKDSPLNVKKKIKIKIKKNYDNDIHVNDNNDNNNNDNDHNDDDNDDDDDDDGDDDDDERPARWCGRGYRGYIYLSILQLDQMKGKLTAEYIGREIKTVV